MNNEKTIDVSELGLSEEELFARIDISDVESEKITAPRYSYWKSVLRSFFRKKVNIFILAVLALIIVFSYIYPLVIGYDSATTPFIHVSDTSSYHLLPFTTSEGVGAMERFGNNLHWILGTGNLGQSTFDAVWNGSRISISLALVCAAINMTIGIVLGAIWGFSKKVDVVMMEVLNVIGNVPYLLIIAVLVRILTASFWTMVFALTITGWLGIAYFIRTQVVIIRDREYNLASRCLGTPILRLTLRNILPFMVSVIVTLAASEIPSYISYEVYLSYIGIGLSDMSLGKIIQETQSFMNVPKWGFEYWTPVVVVSIVTVILYVVGQNLGDASDPKTHM